MTGVTTNAIDKLLVELGDDCTRYRDAPLRNLLRKRLQGNEIWAFVGGKDKNVQADKRGQFGIGAVWTWTRFDANTKLTPSWLLAANECRLRARSDGG